MILGYLSIATAIIILVLFMAFKVKPWMYYAGIYISGLLLLIGTSCASSQLVGSDINLEFYYASQVLQHGWDTSLPCTINSCYPVVILAPSISNAVGIDLIWVFKIVFPVLFAFVPVLLVWIYSRFIPIKWAYLSAFFWISIPTFTLEMPAITRQMFAELLIVSMVALLLTNIKYKLWILIPVSLLIVVSHYSSAYFWFAILGTTLVAYLILKQPAKACQCGITLTVSIIFYGLYAHWVSSGWIGVDTGNAIGKIFSQPSFNYWMTVPVGLVLLVGLFLMLRSKNIIPSVFKGWMILAGIMILASMVYPAVASPINYSRYLHFALIFITPAVLYLLNLLFKTNAVEVVIIFFIVTSGLLFNILQINTLTFPLPYSIALENQRLDAGNYLTLDDDNVAAWAFDNGYPQVSGDLGGVGALQHYYSLYQVSQVNALIPGNIVLLRTWNNQHNTLAVYSGIGQRIQEPIPDVPYKVLYQSGDSKLVEVQ